jgi:serine/threonine protein kinase
MLRTAESELRNPLRWCAWYYVVFLFSCCNGVLATHYRPRVWRYRASAEAGRNAGLLAADDGLGLLDLVPEELRVLQQRVCLEGRHLQEHAGDLGRELRVDGVNLDEEALAQGLLAALLVEQHEGVGGDVAELRGIRRGHHVGIDLHHNLRLRARALRGGRRGGRAGRAAGRGGRLGAAGGAHALGRAGGEGAVGREDRPHGHAREQGLKALLELHLQHGRALVAALSDVDHEGLAVEHAAVHLLEGVVGLLRLGEGDEAEAARVALVVGHDAGRVHLAEALEQVLEVVGRHLRAEIADVEVVAERLALHVQLAQLDEALRTRLSTGDVHTVVVSQAVDLLLVRSLDGLHRGVVGLEVAEREDAPALVRLGDSGGDVAELGEELLDVLLRHVGQHLLDVDVGEVGHERGNAGVALDEVGHVESLDLRFELVEGTPRANAIRVIFIPTNRDDIEYILKDPSFAAYEKDAFVALEICRLNAGSFANRSGLAPGLARGIAGFASALQPVTSSSVSSEPATPSSTPHLALLVPFKRGAETSEDDMQAHTSATNDRPDRGTISVLIFIPEDVTRNCIRRMLGDIEATLVLRATSTADFKDRLRVGDRIHLVIIDKTLPMAADLRDFAFKSRWGKEIIVAFTELSENRSGGLARIDNNPGREGGLLAYEVDHLGEPYAITKKDFAENTSETNIVDRVWREFTLYLPVKAKPLNQLIAGEVGRIEADRKIKSDQEDQRRQELEKQQLNPIVHRMLSNIGTFGVVHLVTLRGQLLARKLVQASGVAEDGRQHQDRCLMEVTALEATSSSPYVVQLRYRDLKSSEETFSLYLEYCPLSLKQVAIDPWSSPATTEPSVTQTITRLKVIARAVSQLTQALAAVHRAGWVHLDVKVENVMCVSVTPESSQGYGWNLRLLDFSEASRKGMRLSGTRGTHGYIAPEMHQEACGDEKVDIYALGVVAMVLAGWRPPQWQLIYETHSPGPGMYIKLHSLLVEYFHTSLEPVRSGTVNKLRAALLHFCLSCLHLDPAKRPTADALLQSPLIQWIEAETDNGESCIASALEKAATAPEPPRPAPARASDTPTAFGASPIFRVLSQSNPPSMTSSMHNSTPGPPQVKRALPVVNGSPSVNGSPTGSVMAGRGAGPNAAPTSVDVSIRSTADDRSRGTRTTTVGSSSTGASRGTRGNAGTSHVGSPRDVPDKVLPTVTTAEHAKASVVPPPPPLDLSTSLGRAGTAPPPPLPVPSSTSAGVPPRPVGSAGSVAPAKPSAPPSDPPPIPAARAAVTDFNNPSDGDGWSSEDA